MRAAVLSASGRPLTLEERPYPTTRAGEVVVEVRACGVCGTDVHLADGKMVRRKTPLVLGHEIAGHVEGLGSVLVYGMWGCGSCASCERGEFQFCADSVSPGFERDGGYAEAVVVPSNRFLVPIQNLDPVKAAPLADAGLTSYHAVRRSIAWLEGDAVVVVIGAGGLGQFAIQWLRRLSNAASSSLIQTSRSCSARLISVPPKPIALRRASGRRGWYWTSSETTRRFPWAPDYSNPASVRPCR